MIAIEQITYLGPARVVMSAGRRVKVELPDEVVWAQLALASPYQPEEGDRVLVMGQAGSWYAIGLLEGAGTTVITVPGDLELHAPKGAIRLRAGRGIHLRSPRIRIASQRLELFANDFLQRFRGDYRLKAERINEEAKDDVRVDGRKIHLG